MSLFSNVVVVVRNESKRIFVFHFIIINTLHIHVTL